MKAVKKMVLGLATVIFAIFSLFALFALIVIEKTADFKEGRLVVFILFLAVIAFFGFLTVKCLKAALHRETENNTNELKQNLVENNHIDTTPVKKMEVLDNKTDKMLMAEETQQFQNAKKESAVINAVVTTEYPKFPKCNCDGCPKQEKCQYGHVVYDEFTDERMTLFDKFMMLDDETTLPPEPSLKVATNEELHEKKLLMRLDKDALSETLEYLQNMKKYYYDYGKCGRAYFNFMKMGDELLFVKGVIREYDEYHNMLNSIEILKKAIIYKIDIEKEFVQEILYNEFKELDRSWITTAVRQLEKEKIIVREKCGKSYIIRKTQD